MKEDSIEVSPQEEYTSVSCPREILEMSIHVPTRLGSLEENKSIPQTVASHTLLQKHSWKPHPILDPFFLKGSFYRTDLENYTFPGL